MYNGCELLVTLKLNLYFLTVLDLTAPLGNRFNS